MSSEREPVRVWSSNAGNGRSGEGRSGATHNGSRPIVPLNDSGSRGTALLFFTFSGHPTQLRLPRSALRV